MRYLLALSTAPTLKKARQIARILLDQKHAACINLCPGLESHYWWEGKKQKDREVLMLIKTARPHLPAIQEIFRGHHPYSVPELIAVPIVSGSRKYLSWLRKTLA